ncbi:MAG: nucleoside-diphosphate sugar epimerase/dehydratase [Kiritimatiellales bacterium]
MVKIAVRRMGWYINNALHEMTVLRRVLKVLWHLTGVVATYWMAFLLRFDGAVPFEFMQIFLHTLPVLFVICLLSFLVFRLFSDVWSYFSVDDLVRLISSVTVATGVFALIIYSLPGQDAHVPRSVVVLEFILLNLWLGGGRLGARYMRRFQGDLPERNETGLERMLLVGTLAEADMVIRESKQKGLGQIVGVVGDDAGNQNVFLHGVRVFHRKMEAVGELALQLRPDSILILPPYNRPRQINKVMGNVAAAGVTCKFRTIPSLGELASGHLTASSIRSVGIEDLLARGEISLDRTDVRRFLKGKKVMITGAGGSIGSELSRQIAGYEPEALVLFEQSEFGLYTIEQELQSKYPNLRLIAVAGDVRREDAVRRAIRAVGKIDVIYHAAAYKHVPLMEKNVAACFRTNVLGTACLARIAVESGVDRFVMISSDKAVRPTSIMGATKRIAERVINEMECGSTTFVSVRFGNVLGSSGSVVPLFKRQIAAGGPVTVTSPNMRRFFMTIPEAVDLVLQAATIGRNREIMVLEMGEEIKIIDLARRLIELSGLKPDEDIKIEMTGLRPGEKEYEEVITEDENVVKTSYEKIWVMTKNAEYPTAPPIDLEKLDTLIFADDTDRLRALAACYVPENCFCRNPSSDE